MKNLATIAATAIVLLILLATSLPLMHWFSSAGRDARLAAAEETWAAQQIVSYDFSLHKACECPPPAGRPIDVSVRQTGVSVRLDGGESVDAESLRRAGIPATVAELFAIIHAQIADDPDLLHIEYDPDYGLPRLIQIDRRKAYTDDDVTYTVTAFRPRGSNAGGQ